MSRVTIHSRMYQSTLAVYQDVLEMTPRQRRAALKELGKLTRTNCSWHLFAMRNVLKEFIHMASPGAGEKT